MKYLITATSLTIVLLISACTTTSETDPTKVSMGDLWAKDNRLNAYLAGRHQELERLKGITAGLETRLTKRREKLEEADRQYRSSLHRSQKQLDDRSHIDAQLIEKQAELTASNQEIKTLVSEMGALQKDIANKQEERRLHIQHQIARYEVEIEDLDQEITLLENSIDRLLKIRAERSLGAY